MKSASRLRGYAVGIATLVVVFAAVHYIVGRNHRPGSMTVIEAQAMDMSVNGTPVGAAPVVTEIVHRVTFAPAVTYTGTAVAFTEEDVYPRVTGRLVSLDAYPGQRVAAGQVIGRLDSAELSARADEAEAGRMAAGHVAEMSKHELEQSQAAKRSAQAKLAGQQSALRDAQAQVASAQAMRDQADKEAEAAQAGLGDAQANVAAMQADADYWSQELIRQKRLLDAKAVSREEYQREEAQAKTSSAKVAQAQAAAREKRAAIGAAEAKRRQADAAIGSAQARGDQARHDIEAAKADLSSASANTGIMEHHIAHNSSLAQQAAAQARTAEIVRDYTVLRAGRAGVVAERLVSPGTLVQPGMAIARIKDDSQMRLQANVPEADLAGVRIGSAVTATSQRDPSLTISARITSVFGAANAQTRTTIVEAVVPNPGGRLQPGQYVVMRIATGPEQRAITVPASAVARDVDQKPYVWTMAAGKQDGQTIYACVMHPEVQSDKPGKCYKCGMDLVLTNKGGKFVAHRMSVTLGQEDGQRAVVVSGLNEGDEVIVRGQDALNEGDPVTAGDGGLGLGAGSGADGRAERGGAAGREMNHPSGGPAAKRPPDATAAHATGSRGAAGREMNHPSGAPAAKRPPDATAGREMNHPSGGPAAKRPPDATAGRATGSPGAAGREMNHPSGGPAAKRPPDATAGRATGSPGAAIYTCPMHPEVRSDRPGNCPKCGMKLELVKGSGGHGGQ